MIPDPNGDNNDPEQCRLHASTLKEIKHIVLDTRREVIEMKAMGGPISEVDKKADRALMRVSEVEKDVGALATAQQKLKEEQNALIVKVGVILSPVAALVGAFIASVVEKL